MSFLQSLILGIVQGLTEFLPISSSAHLVLVPFLLKWNIPQSQVFPFDVLVQIGTLLAVIIYFWKDLWVIIKAFFSGLVHRKPFEDTNARMGWYLILATIPAGLAGLLLKDRVEAAFNSPRITAWFLIGTAVLLVLAEFFSRRSRKLDSLKWFDALWIGLFQAASIFPGVSRSGATITGGMTRHFDRPSAARFSFLMSIPVMAAAGLVSALDLIKIPDLASFLPKILLGFLAAGVVGYFSIKWLLSFVSKHSLLWFSAYCVLLAAVVLLVSGVRAQSPAAVVPTVPAVSTGVSTGIASAPSSATALPNQVDLDYTAALDWLTPQFSACADTITDLNLFTNQVSGSKAGPDGNALMLRYGESKSFTGTSVQVGTSNLTIIVNTSNPLTSLTTALARKLFSGQVSTWQAAYRNCPTCFSSKPSADLLSAAPILNLYMPDEDIEGIFEQAVMGGSPVARSSAVIIPSALSMRESVANSPAAIGFAPSSALDGSVRTVDLKGVDISRLTMPILALSTYDPYGNAAVMLMCITEALNP